MENHSIDERSRRNNGLTPVVAAEPTMPPGSKKKGISFEGKAECAPCRPATYFTNRKMHNVGVLSKNEPYGRYDTPSLVKAYLHDGRALTIKDVLTTADRTRRHEKLKPSVPI